MQKKNKCILYLCAASLDYKTISKTDHNIIDRHVINVVIILFLFFTIYLNKGLFITVCSVIISFLLIKFSMIIFYPLPIHRIL